MSDNAEKAKKQASNLVDELMEYIGDAFDAGFNAARDIHQAGFEIPLNILQSAGLPEDLTKSIKEKHEDVVGSIYDSVHSVINEVGKAGAGQIRLARNTVLDERAPKKKAKLKAKSRAKSAAKRKSTTRAKAKR